MSLHLRYPCLAVLICLSACDAPAPPPAKDVTGVPAQAKPAARPAPAPSPVKRPAEEPLPAPAPKPPAAAPEGEALPLARILQIAQEAVQGEVIEVDLDEDDGVLEYEVTILTPQGRSIEAKIDARTGTILEVEED